MAAVMQMQIDPVYEADHIDQTSDDISIDIVDSTPDAESAQQHNSTSPFAERATLEEADKGERITLQETMPEPQLLLPPQSAAPVIGQHEHESVRGSPSDAAGEGDGQAAMNGSTLASPAEDSSGSDEIPLVRMRSQDVSAPAQRLGSAQAAEQQQQSNAQSRLAPLSSIETPKKQPPAVANGHITAMAGKKRALEQDSGDSTRSSSGDEDASGAPAQHAQGASQARKKRRNVLPVIRKDQRCGHCRTCLNPQMKKACLTRRAEMMKDMDKKGDLPLSLLATAGKQKNGSAAPKKASLPGSAASDPSSEEDEDEEADPWGQDVQALNLSRNGGLPGPKRVPLFLKVLRGSDTRDKRLVALKILDLSRGEALDAFTHSATGLKTLGEWVRDATISEEASVALAKHVLALLRKLPIDIEALRISGIAKLLKTAGKKCPKLQEPARQLVETWKKLVPADPAAPAQKRPAAPASLYRQDSDSKKPKADPQKASAVPPLSGKPAGVDAKRVTADSALPASSQAAAGAGIKSLLVASDFAELDTPPAVFRKAPPKEAPQQAKKIQVLEGSAAKTVTEDQAAPEAVAAAATGAAAGPVAAPASSTAPLSTATGFPVQPKKTTVTVSIGAPKHNFGAEPSVGYTGTRLGGPPPADRDLRSAAERAAEAALKVPDPVPDPDAPRRVKRKSVSWADDSLLQSVRLFSLLEAPNKVGSGEAQAREAVLPVSEHAEHAVRPPGFENAARQEHHNEAAALRNLHEQGEPEAAQEPEVDDTDVSPELEWCEPALCVLWEYSLDSPQQRVAKPQPDSMFACGELSQERQEREAYRHLHPYQHFGPGGRAAPPCPEELPSAQQRPLPGQVPRRVPWEQVPALLSEPILAPTQPQPQPQPQPYLPPPPAQQQPAQAIPAPALQMNMTSQALQQLLLSVSQKTSSDGQPGQQRGDSLPQQVPVQGAHQPQQQLQWNVPNPQMQPPPQGNMPFKQGNQKSSIPMPISLPAPGNTNPQQPHRQQAASRASTRQPNQAQQCTPPVTLKPPTQPNLAQPPASQPPQQQRPPVVLKAPGLPLPGPPAQQRQPGPVAPPRPAQAPYPLPPQAPQQRPAQPVPAYNQHLPQGFSQAARPPAVQQAPWQGRGNHARHPGPAPMRPAPSLQFGPPRNAPRPQQGPRSHGRALCTYFNTPRGCRKGDKCEFVHERQ